MAAATTRPGPLAAPVPAYRLKNLSGITLKTSTSLVVALVIRLSHSAHDETVVQAAAVVTTTERLKSDRTLVGQPVTIDRGGLLDYYLRTQLRSELGRPEERTVVLHDPAYVTARQCERFGHVAAAADLYRIPPGH